MKQIFIINGHQPTQIGGGKLNKTLADRAAEIATQKGYKVTTTKTSENYDIETEIQKHVDADLIIMQFPINWMGAPWSLKKYIDEVYTSGSDGQLCLYDGRTSEDPKKNYGTGGALKGSFMMSVTFNAPREAFEDINEPLFAGKSVDDLLYPMHVNAKFLGLKPLPTFAAFDVLKNPEIEADLQRFDDHIEPYLI